MNHYNKIFAVIATASLILTSCADELDYYNSDTTMPVVGINDDELVLDGKAEEAKIQIKSNMWWKASVQYPSGETEEWCVLTPSKGYGNVDISVACKRNYNLTSSRKAIIVIEGDDANTQFRKEFTVTQNASQAYIEVTMVDSTTESHEIDVPIVSSRNELTVKTNDEWTVSSDQSWCTVSGTGEIGESVLQVSCAVNTSGAKRVANVTLKNKDGKVVNTFKVSQSDIFGVTVMTVEKTPSSFKVSWTPVVGASSYEIQVEELDGTVAIINAAQSTEYDLASDPLFATPKYAGWVKLSIKTLSEDPTVFSVSKPVESNSHFTSGKGTQAEPFIIGDMESLSNISKANPVLAGAYYKLEINPVMDGFKPLCSANDKFSGIFDGNGKEVDSWKPTIVADKTNCFGFFSAVAPEGKVSNLKFNDCSFSLTKGDGDVSGTDNGIGFIAGINDGLVSNMTITNCSVSTQAGTSPLYVGGVAGQNAGSIISCKVTGGRLSAASDRNKSDEFNCGGITGFNMATGKISDCVNGNEIIGMTIIGGIAGYNDGEVLSCGNTGKITANYYFGGIVGYVKTTGNSTFHIKDCYNTGTIVMDEPSGFGRGAAYVGGITSRIHSVGTAVENCYSSGDMVIGASVSSSSLRIGGLVGHVNNTGSLINSYFCGNVTIAANANYGGIVGEFADKATHIVNCYSIGKLTKTETATGNLNDAFGKLAKSATVTSCYAVQNGGNNFAGGTATKMDSVSGYLTETQMKSQSSFKDWDFSGVWKMNGYPQLISNPQK